MVVLASETLSVIRTLFIFGAVCIHKIYHHLSMVPKNLEPLLSYTTVLHLALQMFLNNKSTFRFLLHILNAGKTVGQLLQLHHPQTSHGDFYILNFQLHHTLKLFQHLTGCITTIRT